MSPLLGQRPSLWITHKENGLMCPSKYEGSRDNSFLVTYRMIDLWGFFLSTLFNFHDRMLTALTEYTEKVSPRGGKIFKEFIFYDLSRCGWQKKAVVGIWLKKMSL
jgi:hypothetical protein